MIRSYEWVDYDDETGRVYADGDPLPATAAFVLGDSLEVDFKLENGLTASLSVTPSFDPEDRVLFSPCYKDDADPVYSYWGVVVHQDSYVGLGFDARLVPPGEAWVVDEHHRYGGANVVVEAPASAGTVRRLLAEWSNLRMVDKRVADG